MQRRSFQIVQAVRSEVGHDVVVQNGGQERATEKLRECDVRIAQSLNPVMDQALKLSEKSSVGQKGDREEQRE